jgi:dTDP-4-dehydrorhamnose 3,5-epimerase
MNVEPFEIAGTWLVTPDVHSDDRGSFLEWFRGDVLEAATGRRFEFVQANHSISKKGVVRGVHFADVPPGQAKYVYCDGGEALDVVVDLRAGSPTFSKVACVRLDAQARQGLLIMEGLGHAFCALRDGTSLTYLVSTVHTPDAEHVVSPFDPALAIAWPTFQGGHVMSARDASAPSLQEMLDAGLLPSYAACKELYTVP